MIKIILREDVQGQGKKGDILNVSDGFARNYLIPKGKAVIATDDTVKKIEQEQKNISEEEKKSSLKNESLKKQLESLTVEIKKKTEGGKLFGSVSAKDVVSALEAKKLNISPKNVIIDKPIKSLGEHVIGIELDKKHKAVLKIQVEEEK